MTGGQACVRASRGLGRPWRMPAATVVVYLVLVVADVSASGSSSSSGRSSNAARFARGVAFPVTRPQHVVVFDADDDSDVDIVAWSASDGTLILLGNLGNKRHDAGAFSSPTVLAEELSAVSALQAVDVDQDGSLDLIVALETAGKIVLLRNKGRGGGFAPAQTIVAALPTPSAVAAADLDQDGDLDLVVGCGGSGMIVTLLNTHADGFVISQYVSRSDPFVRAVIAADLDGDHAPDVASASADDGHIAVFFNIANSNGKLAPAYDVTTSATGASDVVAADFNGDGYLDLASAAYHTDTIAVYLNKGQRLGFAAMFKLSQDAEGAEAVLAVDLDADGAVDVVSASWRDDKVAAYYNEHGDAGFPETVVVSHQVDAAAALAAGDIDGDGDEDLVACSSSVRGLVVFWNKGCPAGSRPTTGPDDDAHGAGCAPCPAGTYSLHAALACIDCPAETWSPPGASSCTAPVLESVAGVVIVLAAVVLGSGVVVFYVAPWTEAYLAGSASTSAAAVDDAHSIVLLAGSGNDDDCDVSNGCDGSDAEACLADDDGRDGDVCLADMTRSNTVSSDTVAEGAVGTIECVPIPADHQTSGVVGV